MTYAIPTHPWQMVAQDLFMLNNQNYLVTIDYFSDYWELDILPDTTSETIVTCLGYLRQYSQTMVHNFKLNNTLTLQKNESLTISLVLPIIAKQTGRPSQL